MTSSSGAPSQHTSTLTLRLEAYSREAKQHIASAQALADTRQHPEVEPLHLLYKLVEHAKVARGAVARAGVEPDDLLAETERALRGLARVEGVPSYLSPRTLDVLGRAEGEAARAGGIPVSVRQLMLACAQETEGPVKDVLRACGLSAPILRATLGTEHEGANGSRTGTAAHDAEKEREQGRAPSEPTHDEGNPVERFGHDLTRLAAQGRFDPLVGRDAELRRVLQVLARRRENNPVLVGEPGIGKTALVQGLAARIARGDVPRMLAERRIVALETGALVAGAKLRGQLEERVRSVLDAVRDAGGEILLFLRDLATLVGDRAGGAGDVIATALARGELRAIAVATPDELRKVVDSGSPLARRFVTIPVEPPSIEDATGVLRGVVQRFEIDHGVRIADPALVSAARLARRYVPGVQLPKGAIDLIDEAAARVRVEMESMPAELDALERRLEAVEIQQKSLHDDHDTDSAQTRDRLASEAEELRPRVEQMRARWTRELELAGEVRRLKEELGAAERELEQARHREDQKRAGELRFGTIPMLQNQLQRAEESLSEHGEAMVHDTVTSEDVADVVAAWTGVPVSRMMEAEADKLLRMEQRLKERVVGQDEAVTAVSRAVRRGRLGLRDPKRPIGSFLFLGPTGVGKTELAKALAEFLFDDEGSLTRLDMSEFMEKHMVARLLGAPPGYVDSDEGGFLTEAVRQRPYSVILFDEMEKAHTDVFNIMLQLLDDGRLTDSRGRPAHFTESVVIMTSNVGSERILHHQGSVDDLRDIVSEAVHAHFRPEFLNRVDEIVVFNPLGHEHLRGIVDIQLRHLRELLEPRHIGLEVTDAARDRVVELGYEPAFGARPLKRIILKELQDPLADHLLRGGWDPGDTAYIDVDDHGFTFTKKSGS